jgi:hypothetical protein
MTGSERRRGLLDPVFGSLATDRWGASTKEIGAHAQCEGFRFHYRVSEVGNEAGFCKRRHEPWST